MADGIPQFQVAEWLDTFAVDPDARAFTVQSFVERYELWEGTYAGQPFKLLPYQQAIINRIYGPVVEEDGSRLVRTAALWLPRGNAKTSLSAALALCHLYGPEAEAGGQIVLAAADKGNAGIAYKHCYHMSKQHDWPKDKLRHKSAVKETDYTPNNSTLKAISAEPYSKHGMSTSFFLADEIHAWPELYARDLFGIVTDSMAKRTNPLTVIISVAPEGTGGLAVDLWDYSMAVARGEENDPRFAPIIFAADPECDWKDEKVWFDVNPALTHGLLSIEELRDKVKKADRQPSVEPNFKHYHLNIPQEGIALPWIDLATYDAAQDRTPLSELEGAVCWVGVDLSSTTDLTAVVAVFPTGAPLNRAYDVLPMFFLPEEGLAMRADEDRANYVKWRNDGFLKVTEGNVIDKQAIIDYIVELGNTYSVRNVVFDPYRAVDCTVPLQEKGFACIRFGQGFLKMAAPIDELERAILTRQFRHGGNPLLRMCFGNATAIKDGHDNRKLTKAKSRGRIDGTVAAAIAIGGAQADDTPQQEPGFILIDGFGTALAAWG